MSESKGKGQAISSGSHPVLALSKMKSLREKSALCDITLQVGDTKIPAHKVILAASSPYFEFMFTSSHVAESTKESIEIKGFCPKAFSALVDFIYSGYLYANEDTITDLLKVADFLKVASAKEQCLSYMYEHLNVPNCVAVRRIARQHFFVELEKRVNNFISHNLVDVIKSEGFLELSLDEMKSFITEESFYFDESISAKAISSWINHDNSLREEFKESVSQLASVYSESKTQRGLNTYNAVSHSRVFFFYKEPEVNWAFHLHNTTWHCARTGPVSDFSQSLFHDDSICQISTNKNECGIYNLKEGIWTTNVMPLSTLYSGACSDHNRIYLTSSEDSNATFSYDVRNNALYMEPSLIVKRARPGITFSENCVYVCGGESGSAEFRDIRTKDWRSISNLPKGSEHVSATSLFNKVYCLSSSKNLFQYDKCNGVWIKKAAIPAKGSSGNEKTSSCAKRYKIGSTDKDLYAHCDEVFYKYDINKDEWKILISGLNAADFVCIYPRL